MSQKILLVEDEPHIVHVIRYKLERAGYHVESAEDGETGYELAQTFRPDLIVTDFQMPVVSGYDMCVRLHDSDDTADTPIVMVTARGHKLSPEQLARTNIRQLMCKPFSARELLRVVEELLFDDGRPGASGEANAA